VAAGLPGTGIGPSSQIAFSIIAAFSMRRA